MWSSQETALSFSQSFSRSQKPSDVLKRMRLKTRTARPSKAALINTESFSLKSLETNDVTPWAIQRLKEKCDDPISKDIFVDEVAKKRVVKKKTRVPKRSWDLSYVEGATTSEEDSDEETVKTCPIYKRIPGETLNDKRAQFARFRLDLVKTQDRVLKLK